MCIRDRLYILGVIANMCASFQAPLVLPLGQKFGVGPNVVGMIMSAQFIAYLLGGSAVGKLVAGFGVRRASQVGLLLIAVTSVANWGSPSLGVFVLSNIVQGLGMLITVVAGQIGAAAIATDETRARLIATWATAPLIGLAFGLLLASQFADTAAWPTAFLALGGLAGMLLLPSVILPANPLAAAPMDDLGGGGLRGEIGAFRVSLAVGFAVTAINGSVSSWPTYLALVHDTTPGRIGSLSSLALLAGVVGSLAVGAAMGRGWTATRLLGFIIPTALASALIVFGAMTGLTIAIIGMVFWQVAAGAITGLLFAMLPAVLRNRDNLPAATGLLYQFAAIGTMLGAPIYLSLTGLPHASLMLTLVTFGAMIAVSLVVPKAHTRPAALSVS